VFHSIFSVWEGPPLSYLHGKKLRELEEIDAGTNNEQCRYDNKNNVNIVGIFNNIYFISNKLKESYWMNNVSCEYLWDEQ
jgi:hypothetical protein